MSKDIKNREQEHQELGFEQRSRVFSEERVEWQVEE
jgi:hypothetical protein